VISSSFKGDDMRVTLEKILEMGPCYSRGKIEKLFAGRKWLAPRTISKLNIPPDDRIWVLTGLMSGKQQREFSRRCALDVIHLWDASPVVKKYLETGYEEIREAAKEAVLFSAVSAAWGTDWEAPWLATKKVSTNDSVVIARRAAIAASRAAANHVCANTPEVAPWDLVRNAEIEKYISWCIEYLDGTKEITCE
jgi:hypothetical protein